MTWDEDELRAALREGEGETPSPGHIVALGRARQQRRHERLRTVAVAVVVTGLFGGGVGALSQLNGGGESAGSASGKNAAPNRDAYAAGGSARGQAPQAGHGAVGAAPTALAPSAGCPSVVATPAVSTPAHPTSMVPAPGAAGRLFSGPVTSITVCGYQERHSDGLYVRRGTRTLVGSAARALADGLDHASTTPLTSACPYEAKPTVLLIQARSTSGTATPLRIDGGACGATVTSGAAVRYAWVIPKELAALTR